MGFHFTSWDRVMEEALTQWLLDNRPYTRMNTRLKHFIIMCRHRVPGLSWNKTKKVVYETADKLMNGEVGKLWIRDRCYERVLRLYGQNDQRTAQWHTKRGEMITASEVYKIFTTPEARREVMIRKLEPVPISEGSNPIPALIWGTRFEPVAKRIYEKDTKCTILDVSCAQHPRYNFLGASPDGLIIPHDASDQKRYGRLVEFKCPMSRALKDEIPIGYIHQMQMQMECTGIDECEYVEFRFKQLSYNEWVNAEGTKGSFAVYENGKVDYDADHCDSDDCRMIYWVLTHMKKDFVPKDPNWLPDHIEQLQQFWDEIIQHRTNGTKPEEIKKPAIPSLDI